MAKKVGNPHFWWEHEQGLNDRKTEKMKTMAFREDSQLNLDPNHD
jgi:hypothetical protein